MNGTSNQSNVIIGPQPLPAGPYQFKPPTTGNNYSSSNSGSPSSTQSTPKATQAPAATSGNSGGNNASSNTQSTPKATQAPAATSGNSGGNNAPNSTQSTPTVKAAPAVNTVANTQQPKAAPTPTPQTQAPTPEQKSSEETKTNNDSAAAQSSGTTSDVNLQVSVEGIMQNKVKIDAAANSLDTLYRAMKAEIAAISDSWVGPDATVYIEKINKLDPKIEAACSALRKISSTYKKALDEIQENQDKIKNELL